VAFRSMFTYDIAKNAQDAVLGHMAFDVTVFAPRNPIEMQGYEHEVEFNSFVTKCFIDFNPKRRVFYHFNWFPEDESQVTMAFFGVDIPVAIDWFIRTSTIEQVAPCGDLLFKVVKIADDGKYRVLKRTCFLNAVSDSFMMERLGPASSGGTASGQQPVQTGEALGETP